MNDINITGVAAITALVSGAILIATVSFGISVSQPATKEQLLVIDAGTAEPIASNANPVAAVILERAGEEEAIETP